MYSLSQKTSSRFRHWARDTVETVPLWSLPYGKDPQPSTWFSEHFVKCKYDCNIPQHENPHSLPVTQREKYKVLCMALKALCDTVWGNSRSLNAHYSSTHCVLGTRRPVALRTVCRDFTFSPSLFCLHLEFLHIL